MKRGFTVDQEFYAAVGHRIKGVRCAIGMTQAELAEKSGVSRAMIANVESGRTAVTLRSLVMIAPVLGTGLDELAGECSACKGTPPAGFACLSCGRQETPP